MYLGIEIGGTKLQLGVGTPDGQLAAPVRRLQVIPARGATGIREQIQQEVPRLLGRHTVRAIGIGFGGPVDSQQGRVLRSHQIDGWDAFPLAAWCQTHWGLPTRVANDCDAAAVAEAACGAGRACRSVFYVTVGTGVGGGWVLDGQLQGRGQPAIAEIGQMRPGPGAVRPDQTVESLASGRGIAQAFQNALEHGKSNPPAWLARPWPEATAAHGLPTETGDTSQLGGPASQPAQPITAQSVARAAAQGHPLANQVLGTATQVLGWAIAQMVTLIAPERVVVGGGVSLMDEALFFQPLREAVAGYVFPPLRKACELVPAALGELVVIHGAIALAAQDFESAPDEHPTSPTASRRQVDVCRRNAQAGDR